MKGLIGALVALGIIGGGTYGGVESFRSDDTGAKQLNENSDSSFDTPPGIQDTDTSGIDFGTIDELDSESGTAPSRPKWGTAPDAEPRNAPILTLPRRGGTTSCSQIGSFTNCDGPDGNTSCSQIGSFLNCSGPDGQSTSCSQIGSFTNCDTSGGYEYDSELDSDSEWP